MATRSLTSCRFLPDLMFHLCLEFNIRLAFLVWPRQTKGNEHLVTSVCAQVGKNMKFTGYRESKPSRSMSRTKMRSMIPSPLPFNAQPTHAQACVQRQCIPTRTLSGPGALLFPSPWHSESSAWVCVNDKLVILQDAANTNENLSAKVDSLAAAIARIEAGMNELKNAKGPVGGTPSAAHL